VLALPTHLHAYIHIHTGKRVMNLQLALALQHTNRHTCRCTVLTLCGVCTQGGCTDLILSYLTLKSLKAATPSAARVQLLIMEMFDNSIPLLCTWACIRLRQETCYGLV
jgi:hypothetical protein